jgi:hypothetical protein
MYPGDMNRRFKRFSFAAIWAVIESTVERRVVSACRNWIRESGLSFWSSVVRAVPEVEELLGISRGRNLRMGGYGPTNEVDGR